MLAQRCNGTVINADSAQVYRDLRILSARPGEDDEATVPHRLFGHVDGALPYSAVAWATEARAAINDTLAAGRLPILVGGTGLYLRTLIDGIAPVPPIDPDVRADIRAMAVREAHRHLAIADPDSAQRLRPTDTTRVARALEVVRSTGRSITDWQADRAGGIGSTIALKALVILPDREHLNARIDDRVDQMFAQGARTEVAALLARKDIPDDAPIRRAIGVAAISSWIAGAWDEAEAIARTRLATRQYAKRQYTWFRNQPPPDWIRQESIDSIELINEFEIRLRD
jgi:tRNA dimethylallyltransferase